MTNLSSWQRQCSPTLLPHPVSMPRLKLKERFDLDISNLVHHQGLSIAKDGAKGNTRPPNSSRKCRQNRAPRPRGAYLQTPPRSRLPIKIPTRRQRNDFSRSRRVAVQPSQGPRVRVRSRVNCASPRKSLRLGCCTLTELCKLYMFGGLTDDPGTLISQRPRAGPAPHCALHDARLRYIRRAAILDRQCHPSCTDVCRRRGCDPGDRGGVHPNVSTPRRRCLYDRWLTHLCQID